jgi:hypothetical protein
VVVSAPGNGEDALVSETDGNGLNFPSRSGDYASTNAAGRDFPLPGSGANKLQQPGGKGRRTPKYLALAFLALRSPTRAVKRL